MEKPELSQVRDGLAMVAYRWRATLISKDPLDIAFVAFASRQPWFLLATFGGLLWNPSSGAFAPAGRAGAAGAGELRLPVYLLGGYSAGGDFGGGDGERVRQLHHL